MLLWLLLPSLAGAHFFEHVSLDHIPIVEELGGQDYNTLDQNTVRGGKIVVTMVTKPWSELAIHHGNHGN